MKIVRFGKIPAPIMHAVCCTNHEEATKKEIASCSECWVLYFAKPLSEDKALEKFRKIGYEK